MTKLKIDRPPSIHNWVRYNHRDELKTAKAILNFVLGVPQVTYLAALPIIRDRILLKLSYETAIKAAETKGHVKSRPHVAELVKTFFEYDEIRNYSGLPSYDQEVAAFQIGRDIRIPAKPLVVISEEGRLKPIFLVGWATMPLDLYQRRLLMTVLEDAVFSLTDFKDSPAEFISFPKGANSNRRTPMVWQRGDFELLSKGELKDQLDLYLRALALAKRMMSERPVQTHDEALVAAVSLSAQTEMDV